MSSLNWLITLVPAPANAFDGIVEYKSIEDIYDFIISELERCRWQDRCKCGYESAITSEKTDAFYDGDASKWIKYANSLRCATLCVYLL